MMFKILKPKMNLRAFTLSELLIGVAILGLIASFTIPKVLQNVETQQNKAKFKESIAAVQGILIEGINNGKVTTDGDGSYFIQRLNGIKTCTGNSSVQGCSPGNQGGNYGPDGPGVVLHNGVMIYGFGSEVGSEDAAPSIDVNGARGPNQIGVDVMIVSICLATIGCTDAAFEDDVPVGKLSYMWWDGMYSSNTYRDANKALFLSLFSN